MFQSIAKPLGRIVFPEFSGLRIMMMPFRFDDPDTLDAEQLRGWKEPVTDLLERRPATGIGYLTIDEAIVEPGRTHRRPGLHVDGLSSYGGPSPYGGGVMPYGGGLTPYAGGTGGGMVLAANVVGTRAWVKDFHGDVGVDGDCEHLRAQCPDSEAVVFGDHEAWWCGPLCVHEGVPAPTWTKRQLIRISYPSAAPHHWPYTPNVTGVVPITPPGPDRSKQMAYRK